LIFQQNLRYIEEHNSKNLGFWMGINQFADLTDREFLDIYANPLMAEEQKESR
jgi:hypothetical protein